MKQQPGEFQLWIGGEWTGGSASADVIDPYTQQLVARVTLADERLIDRAITAAHEAFSVSRRLAPFERSEILSRAADGIRRRKHQFADTIVTEAGKPIVLAEAEVDRAVTTFIAAAEEVRRFGGEALNLDAFPAGRDHFGLVRRFPIGVVYGISPFNFPLNLVAHKVAPAMACGNTIIIKPSPRTPLSALLLAEVLDESGIPPGAVNVIVTTNELATRALGDERVKHVSFTGSVPVGWAIKEKAARKRVTLELGGNAGLIIHDDADLAAAIPAAAAGAFSYAGQSCISVQRMIVQRSIYECFGDEFVRHVKQNIRAGDPRDRSTVVGPLIDAAAVQRVRAMLDDAVRAGARVVQGGTFSGHCLEPTVLESVDPKLDLCAKEAFAPIVTLQPYDRFDDAIAQVNDSIYGLQAGVFTRDIGRAFKAFEALEVGGVMINQVPTWRAENMPYGGVKLSGFGREGIRYAMEEMTEPRVMVMKLKT